MSTLERYAPELVVGFVAPSGNSYEEARDTLAALLREHDYQVEAIRVSDFLVERAIKAGRVPETISPADRIRVLQLEGDDLRRSSGRADALSFVAVSEIVRARDRRAASGIDHAPLRPAPAVAYMVWSFKRPEEVDTLRAIYRSRFFLISVYSSPESREDRLARRFAAAENHVEAPTAPHRAAAVHVVAADEQEVDDRDYGQSVRDAYPLADFFVDASTKRRFRDSLKRAVDIIFSDPFATPTRDEYGMCVANAAMLRSAELGRQVGAALATPAGDIVATGVNEVPAAGGGHYWEGDERDVREFQRGEDASDVIRARVAGQIAHGLVEAGVVAEVDPETPATIARILRQTRMRDVTEFGRAVHAESSALIDAARRGTSILGATLYVTTFPCHQCTRNVIAAGVARIVYVFPYSKSLANELHGDAVQSKNLDNLDNSRIPLMPFLGVAPRQYVRAFSAATRKDTDGRAVPRDDPQRPPSLFEGDTDGQWDAGTYVVREQYALKKVDSIFETGG